MKKNFKSVMSTVFAALTLVSTAAGFTSCQDDNYDTYQNDSKSETPKPGPTRSTGNLTFKEGLSVYPLIYTSYKTKYDVEITSPDTTTMSISSALLKSKNIELKEGNVISVWRNNTEMPFMRQITGVTQNGYNVDVTTKDIQVSDVIENANLEFDSKVYVNPSVSATNGDGDLNPEHFISSKDGVYHPVAIFMHSAEEDAKMKELCKQQDLLDGANSDSFGSDVEAVASNSDARFSHEQKGEKKVYVISELEGSNLDLGVTIEDSVKNVRFPLYIDKSGEKPDTVAWFGLNKAYGKVAGGIHASLDISICGIDKFEVGPYYSIKGQVNPIITAKKTFPEWKKDYTILEAQGYSAWFWVGPVPISISFTPSLCVSLQAGGQVEGTVGFNFEASSENHAYAVYENGGWHMDTGNGEVKRDFTPIFAGNIEASAKAGLYLKGAVMLGGVAGPTLKVGPYLKAKAKASMKMNEVKGNVAAKVSLSLGVDGEVGAQVKVWKWDLGEWKQPFKIFENEIWSREWDLDLWNSESVKVAEETGHMTDDMRKVIEDEENRKYIDDKIDFLSAHNLFIQFMTATATKDKEDVLNRLNPKYKEAWLKLEREPEAASFDWEREFQIWYGTTFNDKKVLSVVSQDMLNSSYSNNEFIKNLNSKEEAVLKSLKGKLSSYIETGNESLLKSAGADKYTSVMKDMKCMHEEYQRRLGYYGIQNAGVIDINKDFLNPWLEKYGKDFTNK